MTMPLPATNCGTCSKLKKRRALIEKTTRTQRKANIGGDAKCTSTSLSCLRIYFSIACFRNVERLIFVVITPSPPSSSLVSLGVAHHTKFMSNTYLNIIRNEPDCSHLCLAEVQSDLTASSTHGALYYNVKENIILQRRRHTKVKEVQQRVLSVLFVALLSLSLCTNYQSRYHHRHHGNHLNHSQQAVYHRIAHRSRKAARQSQKAVHRSRRTVRHSTGCHRHNAGSGGHGNDGKHSYGVAHHSQPEDPHRLVSPLSAYQPMTLS